MPDSPYMVLDNISGTRYIENKTRLTQITHWTRFSIMPPAAAD